MKNVEHKLKEATFCGSQRDVHFGQFFVISVSICHQHPILTSFNFSTFLKCFFIEKRLPFFMTTVKCFEHLAPTESLNLLSCDYKLNSATQALFTRANYPVVSNSELVSRLCSFDEQEHILYYFLVLCCKFVRYVSIFGKGFLSGIKLIPLSTRTTIFSI